MRDQGGALSVYDGNQQQQHAVNEQQDKEMVDVARHALRFHVRKRKGYADHDDRGDKGAAAFDGRVTDAADVANAHMHV